MKLPIPQDWNETDWICVKVRWPKSKQWIAILNGFLTSAQRGRTWDETTGDVKAAQDVGWDIWGRNIPLVSCDAGEQDNLNENNSGAGGAVCVDWSELTMPCFDISRLLKIENGNLYAKDDCCNWVLIGELDSAEPLIPGDGDGEIDIPEPIGGYSACGKASAVLDTVMRVIESVWDERGNLFTQWWGHVHADCADIALDSKFIITACVAAQGIAAAMAEPMSEYNPNPLDESTWQSVLCRAVTLMTDTSAVDLNGNDLRAKLQEYFASEWFPDVLINAMFVDVLRAIKREEFENQQVLGAGNTGLDCDCPSLPPAPGGETAPTTGGWYWGTSIYNEYSANGGTIDTIISRQTPAGHDIYGVAVRHTKTGGADLLRFKRIGADDTGADVFMFGGNSDELADNGGEWLIQVDPAIYDEVSVGLPLPFELTPQFASNDVIATPPVLQGQSAGASMIARADAIDGTYWYGTVEWRWLHNINSPSHGA